MEEQFFANEEDVLNLEDEERPQPESRTFAATIDANMVTQLWYRSTGLFVYTFRATRSSSREEKFLFDAMSAAARETPQNEAIVGLTTRKDAKLSLRKCMTIASGDGKGNAASTEGMPQIPHKKFNRKSHFVKIFALNAKKLASTGQATTLIDTAKLYVGVDSLNVPSVLLYRRLDKAVPPSNNFYESMRETGPLYLFHNARGFYSMNEAVVAFFAGNSLTRTHYARVGLSPVFGMHAAAESMVLSKILSIQPQLQNASLLIHQSQPQVRLTSIDKLFFFTQADELREGCRKILAEKTFSLHLLFPAGRTGDSLDMKLLYTRADYPVIILMTVIGNSLVVIAIFNYRPLKKVQNYFLVSLAASDLCVADGC
uniref:G-protein coupled receptors family 1 profile domain-containing protein n=1 Tax=Parascaris equorum TaxID=6256 RepID=A0A914RLG9_PAREQ